MKFELRASGRTTCNVVLPRQSGLATLLFAFDTKGSVLEELSP